MDYKKGDPIEYDLNGKWVRGEVINVGPKRVVITAGGWPYSRNVKPSSIRPVPGAGTDASLDAESPAD